MDTPASSAEQAFTNSDSETSSQKALSSIGQSLVDITKQFLNWPQFGKDLNFTEDVLSSKKEETDQETKSLEYSLAKAQWTPKWPENLNESSISQDVDESVPNNTDSNDQKYTYENEFSLAKAQWTPKWPENFNDSAISQDAEVSVQTNTDSNDQKYTYENELSLAKAQWTPKWPENFNDSAISQGAEVSVQNNTDSNDQKDSFENDQNIGNQNNERDMDQSDPKRNLKVTFEETKNSRDDMNKETSSLDRKQDPNAYESDQKDRAQYNNEDMDQNDTERNFKASFKATDYLEDEMDEQTSQKHPGENDKTDIDQNGLERSSKVSFDTTDYSEITDEIESQFSDDRYPELTVYTKDDVPTLILELPSLKEGHDLEKFKNLLYEIPFSPDHDINVDENISDSKKWFVELGNNRNYIKALINNSVNDNWPRASKSKEDYERAERSKKFKWSINYDNLNYIRSFLSPEIFESLIKENSLKPNKD